MITSLGVETAGICAFHAFIWYERTVKCFKVFECVYATRQISDFISSYLSLLILTVVETYEMTLQHYLSIFTSL